MMKQFDHEKLTVYQHSIKFVAWATDLLESVPKSISAHDQLDRASTSVPLNIAEGNGKSTPKDRCKFFDTPLAVLHWNVPPAWMSCSPKGKSILMLQTMAKHC